MDMGTLALTVLAWVMVFILGVAAFVCFKGMDENGNQGVVSGGFSLAYLVVATVIAEAILGGIIVTIICAVCIAIVLRRTIILARNQYRYRHRRHA